MKIINGKDTDFHISFEEDGRSGYVIIHLSDSVLKWYYEYGGNDVVVSVFIPKASEWKMSTGMSLESRASFLEKVALNILPLKFKSETAHFNVEDGFIHFFSK